MTLCSYKKPLYVFPSLLFPMSGEHQKRRVPHFDDGVENDIRRYKLWLSRRLSPSSVHKYERWVRRYLKYCFDHDYDPLSKEAVDNYLTDLIENHDNNTVYNIFMAVKSFFRYKGKEEEINEVLPPRYVKKEPRDEDILTEEEIRKLIDGIPVLEDKAMIAVLADLGIRRSELLDIRLSDLRLDIGAVRIRRRKRRGDYVEEWVKFRSPETVEILREYLRKRPKPSSRVFPIGEATVYNRVKKWGERILGREIHPHAFRHTTATQIVKNTGNPKLVTDYLGITLTAAERYMHKVIDESEKTKLPKPY